MKDIDFDELDKAVNSLMASTAPQVEPVAPPASSPSQALDAQVVVSPAPSPTATAAEKVDVSGASPVAVAVTQPAPQARPAAPTMRRSGGRFMDMVNTPAETRQRPATSSREGIAISPRGDTPGVASVSTEEPATKPSTESGTSPQPAVEVQSEAVATKPKIMDTMPDPLDMMVATSVPEAAAEADSTTQVTTGVSASEASESPFLSDTKVEKRPLNAGAMLDAEQTAELQPDSLPDLAHDVEDSGSETPETTVADEPPAQPQAPELDKQLVAIESGANTTAPIESSDAASAPAAAAIPLGATSIPQQYAAQPSSGDQSHAAIFDTSQYPEALKHPAKSKSGWLWVLWVVLLLGVGAGGAIGLYSLGIIP